MTPSEIRNALSSSKPCKSRQETVEVLNELVTGSVSTRLSNVHGSGPLLVSDIPETALTGKGGVILGIDEAGRGPVLGPMTYGAAYWHPDESKSIPKTFNDSKQLAVATRNSLFKDMQTNHNIGFVLRVIHASEISRNMLRAEPYNLNAMSHDAAMQMIQAVLDAGVKIDTCYIDTVGIAESYQRKLDREFSRYNIQFVVEKKADAKYATCSAASVIAKVSRDAIIESWKWTESNYEPIGDRNYGSGYPSDPKCKEWLQNNLADPLFSFPDFIRFSWGPAKKALKENGVEVKWQAEEEDEDGEDASANQTKINTFLQAVTNKSNAGTKRKRERLDFFSNVRLNAVTKIVKT